jgi:hypothetical protein
MSVCLCVCDPALHNLTTIDAVNSKTQLVADGDK